VALPPRPAVAKPPQQPAATELLCLREPWRPLGRQAAGRQLPAAEVVRRQQQEARIAAEERSCVVPVDPAQWPQPAERQPLQQAVAALRASLALPEAG